MSWFLNKPYRFILFALFLLTLLFPYEAISECPCWGDDVSSALLVGADSITCRKDGDTTAVISEEIDPSITCPDFITLSARTGSCALTNNSPGPPPFCGFGQLMTPVSDTTCKDMLNEFCLGLNGDLCNGQVPTNPGTDGDDEILGTSGNDVILGFAGNDILEGNGGTDSICGGPDNDRITVRNNQRFNDPINGGSGDSDILVFNFKQPSNEVRVFCGSLEQFDPEGDSITLDGIFYEWLNFEEIRCGPDINIPTLSQWGLIAMAGVLGLVGFMVIKRRKVTA